MLAADERITSWARELKAAGLDGGMDKIRARAYLDLLLGTVTGLADRPGELAGLGPGAPVDPWLARDLARAAAAKPKSTWCVTVTDEDGHAVGHGCARPEPKRHRKRAGPARRAGPGSVSPWSTGTARPADTAPGGCAPRDPGPT